MTVQELIDQLTELKNEGFGETQLVLSVTDHTDWTYTTVLETTEIDEDDIYDEDSDCEENVVVIDCKFW